METTTKKPKIKLKNATHAHIMPDGSMSIGYEELHRTSGKRIQWIEKVYPSEIPFKLHISKYGSQVGFTFKSVYISREALPFLNELERIEIWPVNHTIHQTYQLESVVFTCKNGGSISYDKYTENGKTYKSLVVEVLK